MNSPEVASLSDELLMESLLRSLQLGTTHASVAYSREVVRRGLQADVLALAERRLVTERRRLGEGA